MTAEERSRALRGDGKADWARRRFLRLAAGGSALVPLLILGCGGDDQPSEPSHAATTETGASVTSPTSGSTPAQSASRGRTPTPAPPTVALTLTPGQVGIGESIRLIARAPGAATVAVEFRGSSYRMLPFAEGSFWLILGVPLDAPLAPATVRVSSRDVAGKVMASAETAYGVVTVDRPVDYLQLTASEAAVLTPDAGEREAAIRGLQFAEFDLMPMWSEVFLRPTDGQITTQFGQGRSINGGPVGAFHTGVDLANDEGTPVQVAAPGRVAWAGAMPIRGNSVIVDHGAGVKSGYHHLSAITTSVGQHVATGEVVGLVGMTGLSTGPHLHWELSIWGVNVDPMTWIATWFGP